MIRDRMIGQIHDLVNEAIEDGTTPQEFIRAVGDSFEEVHQEKANQVKKYFTELSKRK